MASKTKLFSWSKGRQSTSEPYHRVGGLLTIDTSVGDTGKEAWLVSDTKNTLRPGRRRPPNLNLTIPPGDHDHHPCSTPASALRTAALANSAFNLLNDMLRSPCVSATTCPKCAEIHKPLPSRPRSASLPSSPNVPVELPGSILLENQGFPSPPVAGAATRDTMRSVRSGNSLSSIAAAKPSPSKVPQHKKSLSEVSAQRRSKSRPSLVSPSSTDSKLTTCSVSSNGGHTSGADSTRARVGADKLQPSPVIVEGQPWRKSGDSSGRRDDMNTGAPTTPTAPRTKQVDELKSTIAAQDSTISTLQAQFGSLRASHEAHVASLVGAHTAEVATLKNYTKVLEEQQSQRTLHHASSNHLLLFLDDSSPKSPGRENSPQNTATTSANSIRSFKSAFEQPRSPQASRDNSEMENLKHKLSLARRPETGNRDTIRELNLYKQNNAALQKQIESLMAKLNQSKTSERALAAGMENIEKQLAEVQDKAKRAVQSEKTILAMQNTMDHLEYRLDMANSEKLDAEEQLLNLQLQRSPFDPKPSKLQTLANSRQSAHTSMSTVFSSGATGSPTSHQNESDNPTTLSAFISHIERLQEQLKQKDSRIDDLEQTNEQMQIEHHQLQQDHKELSLQSDIQGQLLQKTKSTDIHIEQLRTAIIERESIIGEKDKAIHMAERQLEHHKLLLQAEIRRHATLSLYADEYADPLPDLTSLAAKEDIDRWIERLQKRMKKEWKENVEPPTTEPENTLQAVIDDLRKEIDFYVREIIYYKLDIKGYKSDIKKLKHIATRMGSYGSRTFELESPSPSLARSGDTPIRARFSSGTPNLGISASPSPISTGPISTTVSVGRPVTPHAALLTPECSPIDTLKSPKGPHKRIPQELQLKTPMTPHTPPRKEGTNPANEVDNIDPGISPRSVARLSPERRKPTPPSPDQEKFGELATNFPLSTPAAPKRHDTQRSMSDSIIQLYTAPRTPEWSQQGRAPVEYDKEGDAHGRSTDAGKGRMTPERPPRPRYGLFEAPKAANSNTERLPTPPRMDVMAEAMRNSPDRVQAGSRPVAERNVSDSSITTLRGLSNSNLSRAGSVTSPSAIPPLSLRKRAGSSGSSTSALPQASSPPGRKDSTGSGASIPFVIAMGSPHNPALINPSVGLPPSGCSITSKVNVQSPTSRTGVGGTMASSTPVTSPTVPGKTMPGSALPVAKAGTSASKTRSPAHSRSASASSTVKGISANPKTTPRTGAHSRSASGSSIMTAIQLPGSLMKGKGKTRKDSISHPTPLASPFDIDRTTPGPEYGIGEAL
ncbi:hypothetical protein EJ04DRAFT_579840 [Polyplosphaeria fusca]|uniref:Plant heme peroxidase family profile domain-containing protein n=1 Tax=Polyplosphaeria fusca TaxID=682080 RepID=A0A9P4UYY9_9PLEO|nr:hypothetical protein EJ04DRAFT_579840 [Polyplosphaeria fusca]